MPNAWRTAITRKKPSKPVAALEEKGLIVGRVLDYGCGRGHDASHLGAECYDPHFAPDMPTGLFDTVVCNYVLNVIPSVEEREAVLQDIRSRLAEGGRAYISVRTDKGSLNGYTKIGTWQGLVVLDAPVVAKDNGFKTYEVSNG
jgi:ATP adenylyltransferase